MSHSSYDHAVVRGLFYNLLGTVGKAFTPVFFIMVGQLYGAASLGTYLLVFTFIEMLKKLSVGGLNDGVMIFAARHLVREEDHEQAYRSIANSLVLGVGLSVLLLAVLEFGMSALLPMYREQGIQHILRIMAFGLPLQAIAVLLVSATKAHVEMKWDALMGGFIRPFGLFIFALMFHLSGFGLDGLAWGYVMTGAVMFVAALFIFFKHYSLARLLHAFRTFRLMRDLLAFVLPQSLNLTFIDMIAGFDIIMLGFFGVNPALIGYYGIAAQIVLNLEQVRQAFSGAYAPVIARLHSEKRIDEMNASFNKVSRWTMLLAFPLGFLVVLFHRELLQLFHPAFGVALAVPLQALLPDALVSVMQFGYLQEMGETGFMILLVFVPLLSCGIGLAGNLIVMSGLSGWSLLNSTVVAGISFLFAALFIPEYGLAGAALSAVLAQIVIRAVQLVEAEFLLDVRLSPARVYKPYLAAVLSGVFLYISAALAGDALLVRLGLFATALLVYFMILKKAGFEEGDTKVLLPWKKSTGG